jgi:hypothetical protein
MNKLLLAISITLISTLTFAQKAKKITPTHHVDKVYMQGKKIITYYALSNKERTELTLVGPGKLEILLRARLEDTTKMSNPYTIHYIIDNTKSKTDSLPAEKVSKTLKYKNVKLTGKPTQASKIHINIPPGKHVIKFYKEKTDEKIHAVFKYLKDKNEPVWKNINSSTVLDTVRIKYLTEKATIKTFYRISKDKKFTLNTSDSTQLKINVKAELDFKALVGSPLILDVYENGKLIKSFKIKCKKSQKTEYMDDKKLIPGNSNIIYLNLPKGNHTYEFALADKKKTAIIFIEQNKKTINKKKK